MRRIDTGSVSAATYVIPIVLIIVLALGGGAFYIFLKKRDFVGKSLSPSVSFRQGSNVTFSVSLSGNSLLRSRPKLLFCLK